MLKIPGRPEEFVSLNPFSYQTRESVIDGILKIAVDSRRIQLPSWQTGLRSTDDTDFAEFVLLEEEYKTIRDAVYSKRIQVIKASGDLKVDETMVVPARGAPAVWMVTDAWHLSRVERFGFSVKAKTVALSAPFADLASWFVGVSAKVREVKESSELQTIDRALLYIKRKSVGVVTLGAVQDDGKVDRRAANKRVGIGVWAPELFVQPEEARVYAHELILEHSEDGEWDVAKFMDIGFVSLKGAPILGVPPARNLVKAVLGRYITAAPNCFDSKTAVLSRVKMDTALDDKQKREVVNILHRRGTFLIKDALYRYRNFRRQPHVNIILKTPTNGYSQIMLERVNIKDCPTVLLRLVEQSEEWPREYDLGAEEVQLRLRKGRDVSDVDFEQEMAYRKLITAAGKPSGNDTYKEGARLVIALERLINRDGSDNVMKQALLKHRPGAANEFREMAIHFKRMYATNISENVLVFLLVLMIEDQTPYAGWVTRKTEALMHMLNISEKQFEIAEAAVVALKAAYFFGEGILEANREGFALETLVRGLSYSFTWTYVSPEGSLEFFGHSLVEQAPDLLALGPLFGATKFGLGMLAHAKHGFDKVAELQQAEVAATAGLGALTPENVAEVLRTSMNTYVIPWIGTLSGDEAASGEKGDVFGEYTFESTPLGVPSIRGGDSVPLVVSKPADRVFDNLTSVSYNRDTKTLRLTGKDGKIFNYRFYAEFVNQSDELEAAELGKDVRQVRHLSSWWTAKRVKDAKDAKDAKTELRMRIEDGRLIISDGTEVFDRPLSLCFDIDDELTNAARLRIISSFAWEDCYLVSDTAIDSPLGVTLRISLVGVLARTMELLTCTDMSKLNTILTCLLRDEDDLPTFKAMLRDTPGGNTVISDVSREFCAPKCHVSVPPMTQSTTV